MTWALDGNHVNVVRLLLQKDAEDVDNVLTTGVRENNEELVKIALERGGAKAETLTVGLVVASGNEKGAAIADLLKKAGATPPIEVDAATLQSYVGKYKGETGPEVTFTLKDGKLLVLDSRASHNP